MEKERPNAPFLPIIFTITPRRVILWWLRLHQRVEMGGGSNSVSSLHSVYLDGIEAV